MVDDDALMALYKKTYCNLYMVKNAYDMTYVEINLTMALLPEPKITYEQWKQNLEIPDNENLIDANEAAFSRLKVLFPNASSVTRDANGNIIEESA